MIKSFSLKLVLGISICLLNIASLYSQHYISGSTTANVGETKIYTIKNSNGTNFFPFEPYYYSWYVSKGVFTANSSTSYSGYDIPIVNVNWTTPGSTILSVDFHDDLYNNYYYYNLSITIAGTLPDDPGNPNSNGNVCSPSLTRSGTPPSGVTWYWQGKDANGTNTNKGSGTTYVPNEGTGTYYIRARTSTGIWSAGSGSVEVISVTAPLWYTDTDNDGLGDPASTPISSCTKPSGRVSNNFDQCPTQAGTLNNNGCSGSGDVGSTDKNYVHTVIPLIPVTTVTQITNNNDKIEAVAYFDGLGRGIQSVSIRTGGQGQDIKTPMLYDEFGRQAVTYLPHAVTTSSVSTYTSNTTLITGLNSYYVSKYGTQLNSSTPNPYSEQRFDASPLGRVLESGTPGKDWQINPTSDSDHTTKYDYNTNASNEVFKIDYPGTGLSLSLANYYPQGELLKNTVKNENWVTADGKLNTKDIFTDKSGKKIAEYSYVLEGSVKTLKTYYVYDDPGNMVYVLTPKLFTILGSGTTISTTHVNNLAFQYVYDTYNRQIEQKVPGKKQWEYMVYDQLDRPILTQDKELKDQGKWLFTKYDALGRPVYSGLFSSTLTRSALQSAADSYINGNTTNPANKESRTTTASSIGGVSMNYSNNAYPYTGLEVLSVNYYDNYSFTDSDKPATPTTILTQTVTTRTQGLPTAMWSKTLGASTWTKSYTYYDEKGSAIYVYEKNHLGGYTDSKTKLDFRGKVESTTTIHKRLSSSSAITITDRFEYDHAERTTAHYQIVNSNPEQRIAKMTYDELGILTKKEIGGTGGVAFQTLDYTYNIQGSLSKVNDVDNMGTDLFAYELNYQTGEGTNFNAPQYNGNISQVVWMSKQNNLKKTYYYDYDDLNRLVKGRYGDGTSLTSNWLKFEESISGYDHNGNITGVTRKGLSAGTLIDNLTYTYDTGNGNQLMKIADAATTDGFKNGTNTGDDYDYDENGNLIKDLNKNISLIEYNHLDLVTRVTFTDGKKIEFTYDASGNKLQMKYINGASTTTTDYLGGFQYVNNILEFFPTPEGYVELNGSAYTHIYTLRDHLGNTRVSFKNTSGSNVILSSTDYYPMGMTHYGEYVLNSDYNYKYQNKEQLLANGYNMYDFGSRMYDASVGRWFNTDPQNQFTSPYLAMGNNWPMMQDPDGELAWFIPIIIGAVMNVGINAAQGNIQNFWDGLGYAAVGAAAGAIGGGLSTAISSAIGGTGFGAGFSAAFSGSAGLSGSGLTAASSSFFTGAAIGGGSGLGTGFVSGVGNGLIGGSNIGDALGQGLREGAIGGLGGGLIGGVLGGINAVKDGRRFFDGALVHEKVLIDNQIPYVAQRGDMNCGPANCEAISMSRGGNITQESIRGNLGGNPNTNPLGDIDVMNEFSNQSKIRFRALGTNLSPRQALPLMSSGYDVSYNIKMSGTNIGHAVTVNRITERTVTKISGKMIYRLLTDVMNPAVGQYVRVSERTLLNAYNTFLIFP